MKRASNSLSKHDKYMIRYCRIAILFNLAVLINFIVRYTFLWSMPISVLAIIWLVWLMPKPRLDAIVKQAPSNLSLKKKYCVAIKTLIAGTEFIYGKGRLRCIDCEGVIPWSAIIRRKHWQHTACPSCEAYTHFMTAADDAVTTNE